MNVPVTAGFVRPLECQELTNRFEAQDRIARFADIDDLDALDVLCLRGRGLIQEQPIGSPTTLCQEFIRDLTICFGEIIKRYIRADWSIGVEPLGEREYSDPTWILILQANGDSRSLLLEDYVTHRFFQRTEATFAKVLEEVVTMAKDVPGLYIGGYEKLHD